MRKEFKSYCTSRKGTSLEMTYRQFLFYSDILRDESDKWSDKEFARLLYHSFRFKELQEVSTDLLLAIYEELDRDWLDLNYEISCRAGNDMDFIAEQDDIDYGFAPRATEEAVAILKRRMK